MAFFFRRLIRTCFRMDLMSQKYLKFHEVNFGYESACEPLFKGVSLQLSNGWTGIVGANGSGKTTFLKLATGMLMPDSGKISTPSRAVYCRQRTDDPPEQYAALIESQSKAASIIRGRFGLAPEWLERWATLSHGERKRAQIGAALWLDPDVLALDEPTNHVDAEARRILISTLETFQGIGLLVSHDRELIDRLCSRCIFIDPPHLTMRPGGYSKGAETAAAERAAVLRRHALKKEAYAKLLHEAGRRRALTAQKKSKLSKKGILKHDHDAKAKIDGARLSGKDAVGGRLLKQLEGRLSRLKDELGEFPIKKQSRLGIWLPGSISKRDVLLNLPTQKIRLGEDGELACPMLVLRSTDRVALTGPNGSGKSTLLRRLIPDLNAPPEHITYVPQEIGANECRKLLCEVQRLPRERLGHLMIIVSRLGSRPDRLLESAEPSPGETRKLLLALGMTREPHIVIMDEPTNHMDLPSIECLEEALADCPCGLLLVSHDRLFLDKLTGTEWRISKEPGLDKSYSLHIA